MNEDLQADLIASYVDEINGDQVSPIWEYMSIHPEHEQELRELMNMALMLKFLMINRV